MTIYFRDMGNDPPQIWHIDAKQAVRLGVTHPERGPGCYYAASADQDVWAVMAAQTSWFEHGSPFTALTLGMGGHHPRIARPMTLLDDSHLWSPMADANLVASSRSQVEVLAAQLARICRTIHPCPETFATFGHDIRNLLILAATEAEMHWRGVLSANGSSRLRPKTDAYVVVSDVLRLRDYLVDFPTYPWIAPLRPFANWNAADPTNSLGWYAAYNGVKHNRQDEFHKATLLHAFEAVSACAVLLAAQFGHVAGLGETLPGVVRFIEEPSWSVENFYCHVIGGPADWKSLNHPALAAVVERPRRKIPSR